MTRSLFHDITQIVEQLRNVFKTLFLQKITLRKR
uniref:Uncharacterized protein n=1 Tax=Microviridae sp. ctQkk2 TaxID=2826734 RepID=A0A8S5R2D4_9VIRU|nr:MAG TPA: hypothetical protein [Microviridae sp. ctQkk2]